MTLPRALLTNLRQSCGRVHNLGEGQTRDRHLEKVNAAVSEDWLPCDWETDRLLEPEFEQRLRWNGKLLAPPGGRNSVPAPASASAPIPAALPPPAIPPMSAPSPAPPKTFLAVFEPSPPPRIEKSLVRSGNDVPLITMS